MYMYIRTYQVMLHHISLHSLLDRPIKLSEIKCIVQLIYKINVGQVHKQNINNNYYLVKIQNNCNFQQIHIIEFHY